MRYSLQRPRSARTIARTVTTRSSTAPPRRRLILHLQHQFYLFSSSSTLFFPSTPEPSLNPVPPRRFGLLKESQSRRCRSPAVCRNCRTGRRCLVCRTYIFGDGNGLIRRWLIGLIGRRKNTVGTMLWSRDTSQVVVVVPWGLIDQRSRVVVVVI